MAENQRPPSAPSRDRTNEPYLRITVTHPHKMGFFLSSYVTYCLTTSTNLQQYENEHTSVTRRFSDFLRLYHVLFKKYSNEGRIIPPPPKKDFSAMLSVMMSTDAEVTRMNFVEKRRLALERYLNRLASHPVVRQDEYFKKFLQLKTEFRRVESEKIEDSFCHARIMFHSTMIETDDWFQRKPKQLDSFQQQLRRVLVTLHYAIHERRSMSLAAGYLASSLDLLKNYECNGRLSITTSRASGVQNDIKRLHQTLANSEELILPEVIEDYIHFIDCAKLVFDRRYYANDNIQRAERELERRKTQEAKILEHNSTFSQEGRAAIRAKQQWEKIVDQHRMVFHEISRVIKEEIRHYENVRIVEFKEAFIKWNDVHLNIHEQLINCFKEFLKNEEGEGSN